MTDNELAGIVADSIKKYGTNNNDNKFLYYIKKLIGGNRNLFSTVDANRLQFFRKLLVNGDLQGIDIDGEDIRPMLTQDYWKQPDDATFAYVARILPQIREKYPKCYKKVFNGTSLLPAGTDDASKKNPNAKTIWNEVEKVDNAASTGKTGRSKAYAMMNKEEKKDLIKKDLKSLVDTKQISDSDANQISNSPKTLEIISNILGKHIGR